MTIIAPSTVNPSAASPGSTDNFNRVQSGMGMLDGPELDQINARAQQEEIRQAQLTDLDSALDDQRVMAEEMGNNLMQAGMADVAERYRRGSRRQSFNAARRGIAGGSAALEQQAATQAQAQTEGRNVAQQSQNAVLEQVLNAQQERDKLAGTIIKENPYLLQQEQMRSGGINQATQDQNMIAEYERQLAAARAAKSGALGGAIGSTIGNLGQVGMGYAMGGA